MARWLHYIYPTSTPTYVFYNGKVIESRAGGQQGCPLMGACHAVVQRSLLEALGVVPVSPQTSPLLPTLEPPAVLDMSPMFADDGFFAGQATEVQRALEHLIPLMPRIGLRFSKLDIIPSAGARGVFDREAFTRLGGTVIEDAQATIMKCPIGDVQYCEQVVNARVEKAVKVVQKIILIILRLKHVLETF